MTKRGAVRHHETCQIVRIFPPRRIADDSKPAQLIVSDRIRAQWAMADLCVCVVSPSRRRRAFKRLPSLDPGLVWRPASASLAALILRGVLISQGLAIACLTAGLMAGLLFFHALKGNFRGLNRELAVPRCRYCPSYSGAGVDAGRSFFS